MLHVFFCHDLVTTLTQVFICHDLDTGRELAVKVIDINHIDHAVPSSDSLHMQRVSVESTSGLGVGVGM